MPVFVETKRGEKANNDPFLLVRCTPIDDENLSLAAKGLYVQMISQKAGHLQEAGAVSWLISLIQEEPFIELIKKGYVALCRLGTDEDWRLEIYGSPEENPHFDADGGTDDE